jgi:ABC-2 type transport system permease protein
MYSSGRLRVIECILGLLNLARLIYRNIVVNTDPGTLSILIGLPAMYLVFFGFGFQSLVSAGGGQSSYLAFLTPGIIAFQSVMAGTVGGSMLWADRRWGMLAQLLVGPFTRLEYLLGIMFTSVLFGLVGALVMLVGAEILLGGEFLTALGLFVMFITVLVGSIFFGSLMLLVSALVKSINAYNSVQVMIIFVVNFASTVFYPMSSSLPLVLKALFVVNPLTYVANIVRDGFIGSLGSSDIYQFSVLLAVTFVFLLLSVRAYMRSAVSFV